jgi:hypothetical protein
MSRCYILLEMHKRTNAPMHMAALLHGCVRVMPLVALAFPLLALAQQEDRARTEALAS